MRFFYDGRFYKAVKVTGPSHNYLGLLISKETSAKSDLSYELINQNDKGDVNVTFENVKNQVLDGLSKVNVELGTHYHVVSLQFSESDTYSKFVYKELTDRIIKHFHAGGVFIEAG